MEWGQKLETILQKKNVFLLSLNYEKNYEKKNCSYRNISVRQNIHTPKIFYSGMVQ